MCGKSGVPVCTAKPKHQAKESKNRLILTPAEKSILL
jgi:hypothetical protein